MTAIDIQPIVDELTRILETGRCEHGDPLERVRSIAFGLRCQSPTPYQAEKISAIKNDFEKYLKPSRVSITKDEIDRQRHFVRVSIDGLRRAYKTDQGGDPTAR